MAKAGVDINDLPPPARARVLRQLADGLDGNSRRQYKWYERVFRYSIFLLAYFMLGLGRILTWLGTSLETGGQELLKWIRGQ